MQFFHQFLLFLTGDKPSKSLPRLMGWQLFQPGRITSTFIHVVSFVRALYTFREYSCACLLCSPCRVPCAWPFDWKDWWRRVRAWLKNLLNKINHYDGVDQLFTQYYCVKNYLINNFNETYFYLWCSQKCSGLLVNIFEGLPLPTTKIFT